MRVALLDPAGFTPPYDHELASALAALGAEVELLSSRSRFGEPPSPRGYRRRERFYPLSSRLPGRSRLRLPLRVLEHVAGLLALRRLSADILHVQWAPLPDVDLRLLPFAGPTVFTAHDVLPRRSAHRLALWRRLYGRFDRVVVHSEHGRNRLCNELGVPKTKVRVIPHPVFRGPLRRQDDGRTLLFLGVLRPYKQLEHAVEIARRAEARLLVVGDPAIDLSPWRGREGIEWRLGYLPPHELDQALAEATLALFPYRQELDQSGALMQALGAGVPAVAYDVGGLGEPVGRDGAGAVVPPDDIDGAVAAVCRLLDDPAALARARAGAEHARERLDWQASARAHLALYEELLQQDGEPSEPAG